MFEDIKERVGHLVLSSTIRPASPDEIAEATRLHAAGQCPHTIVMDTPSWLYDLRHCLTCGVGLGTI